MPGPLQHSPTPWTSDPFLGWIRAANMEDIVYPGHDHDGCDTIEFGGTPADEVLILHAPDLYHTLREFLDRSIDVVAEGRSEPLARYVAAQTAAADLLNTIMKEAQTNG